MSVSRTPPNRIVAGDSIEFQMPFPDEYVGWTGSARMTGAGVVDGTAQTSGSDLLVSFKASDTEDAEPGNYTITVWLKSPGKRITLVQYPIVVGANLADVEDATLSHAARTLQIIESAIEARISGNSDGGIESYAIEGTTVAKTSLADLRALQRQYAAMVARENNPGSQIKRVNFRMTAAGW